ncbi:MAG: hypothetical protein ACPGED_11420, partial [Flavobacteriales bacterium]
MKIKNLLTLTMLCIGLVSSANARTLEEIGNIMHGGTPLSPKAGSLVHRYLTRTNASTVVRTFRNGHGSQQGVRKLAVALSDQSFSEFINLFGGSNSDARNIFFVYHTPNSGTFHFIYMGRDGSYARVGSSVRFSSPGTMIIPILLDDFEADRLETFLQLGSFASGYARSPWSLSGPNGRYSGVSAFQGCTNWVGQMPLGRNLVDQYVFPSGDNGQNPVRQTLRNYNSPVFEGWTARNERILRDVWQVPGHQQFGDLLYPQGHIEGEFTNIGWIALVALGR